ncbi:hypothetical protein HPG69_006253 [Diceros bicornis minor]|uniref:DUF4550 domain-containing protein n=1 Tax=Diceros bicornis minor TaxID=77932 RepID=A0A7J7EZ90_DICBM|nr:hypothetical protein HPG69_006253 [Diceros bicornis minor]
MKAAIGFGYTYLPDLICALQQRQEAPPPGAPPPGPEPRPSPSNRSTAKLNRQTVGRPPRPEDGPRPRGLLARAAAQPVCEYRRRGLSSGCCPAHPPAGTAGALRAPRGPTPRPAAPAGRLARAPPPRTLSLCPEPCTQCPCVSRSGVLTLLDLTGRLHMLTPGLLRLSPNGKRVLCFGAARSAGPGGALQHVSALQGVGGRGQGQHGAHGLHGQLLPVRERGWRGGAPEGQSAGVRFWPPVQRSESSDGPASTGDSDVPQIIPWHFSISLTFPVNVDFGALTVRPWHEGDKVWVSWTQTFNINMTKELLKKINFHRITLRLWDTKEKILKKIRKYRSETFGFLEDAGALGKSGIRVLFEMSLEARGFSSVTG